jgi:hypothetical protein
MARIYAYEGATDFNTGLIDIKKLADITAKDNALTGDIAALGRVAGNFPGAFSTTVETPWYSRPSVSRAGPAGTVGALTAAGLGAGWEVGLLAGAGAATAGYLGSRLAANRLASPGYQAGLNIRDMRIPVAEPPLGPTIPQSQAVVPFDPRNALVQPADIIGYASDGTPITASQLSNRPNFVMVPERYGPQVSPVAPDLARALPAPSAEISASRLRRSRPQPKQQRGGRLLARLFLTLTRSPGAFALKAKACLGRRRLRSKTLARRLSRPPTRPLPGACST